MRAEKTAAGPLGTGRPANESDAAKRPRKSNQSTRRPQPHSRQNSPDGRATSGPEPVAAILGRIAADPRLTPRARLCIRGALAIVKRGVS